MTDAGGDPGIEERIAELLDEADREFGADLDADVVEESATVRKVVPISPFEGDSAVDVTKQRSYEGGQVTVEVAKRIQCPQCGHLCTGDGSLHPAMCPECGVRFTDLREDMDAGDLDPSEEEELLLFVNDRLVRHGEAPTLRTCVREGPFGRGKTERMLVRLAEDGRLTARSVERDGREVTVYEPP